MYTQQEKIKRKRRRKEKENKETQLAHLDSEWPMSPGGPGWSASTSNEAKQEITTILNSIGDESPDTKKFLEFALNSPYRA